MIERKHVNARMSQIVIHGDTIYLAGQVADDRSAGVREQTREILGKVERLLEEAGSDKTHILSATIWLKDIGNFSTMNEVWDVWLPEGVAPARACVEARLAFDELEVEVGVVAALSKR